MNLTDIVNGVLDREGEGRPPYLAKNDRGGRTSWGISERAHPEAWVNGPPSRDKAFDIINTVYALPFASLYSAGVDVHIIDALVDDAVMRGVRDAIKRFQWVLHETMDGVIGPNTRRAAVSWPPMKLLKAYVVERCVRLARIVEHDPTQATNVVGWITRALTFLP